MASTPIAAQPAEQVLPQPADFADAMADVEGWLRERRIVPPAGPIRLRPMQPLWRRAAEPAQTPAARRRVPLQLADMAYRTLALQLQPGVTMQKVILQHALLDGSLKWLRPQRAWPILLSGQETFEFSALTSYLCVAVHNLLCLLEGIRSKQPAEAAENVLEFLARAEREVRRGRLTLGDMLAAHLIRRALVDLSEVFTHAVAKLARRRLVDYFLRARYRRRLGRAGGLLSQARTISERTMVRLDALGPVLDDRLGWDAGPAARAMRVLSRSDSGENVRRWLAWRIARRMSPARGDCRAFMAAVWSLLGAPEDERACAFAARIVLEAVSAVRRAKAEAFFRASSVHREKLLSAICGRVTFLAHQARRGSGWGAASRDVWDRWQREISRLAWTAIKSGEYGQIFVGQFLHQIVTSAGETSLSALGRHLGELRLERLCREWMRLSLKIANGDRHDAYGRLIAALRLTLAKQHADMARILRAQEALCKVGV